MRSTDLTTELAPWLRDTAAQAARAAGCELIELDVDPHGRGARLRVTVDRPEGVGIEDCARVSREMERLLEAQPEIRDSYRLEVSSPGLTRPLRIPQDLDRFAGRLALLELRPAAAGPAQRRGRLGGLDPSGTRLRFLPDGAAEPQEIEIAAIARARLDFDLPAAPGKPVNRRSR